MPRSQTRLQRSDCIWFKVPAVSTIQIATLLVIAMALTLVLFTAISLTGMFLVRYLEVYPSLYGEASGRPFGVWEVAIALGFLGLWGTCYLAFMNEFPRMRVLLMTSPYRDEVQVPVDAETMEPLPAHE